PADTTDLLLRSMDVFMAKLAVRAVGEDPAINELANQLAQHNTATKTRRATLPGKPAPVPVPTPTVSAAEPALDRAVEDWRIGPRHVEMLMREVERLRELRLRLDEQKRELERSLRGLEHKTTIDASMARGMLNSITRVLGVESEEANDIV